MAYIGFDKLKARLARKGAADPAGEAAAIGQRKYGKRNFQRAASEGRKMGGRSR